MMMRYWRSPVGWPGSARARGGWGCGRCPRLPARRPGAAGSSLCCRPRSWTPRTGAASAPLPWERQRRTNTYRSIYQQIEGWRDDEGGEEEIHIIEHSHLPSENIFLTWLQIYNNNLEALPNQTPHDIYTSVLTPLEETLGLIWVSVFVQGPRQAARAGDQTTDPPISRRPAAVPPETQPSWSRDEPVLFKSSHVCQLAKKKGGEKKKNSFCWWSFA